MFIRSFKKPSRPLQKLLLTYCCVMGTEKSIILVKYTNDQNCVTLHVTLPEKSMLCFRAKAVAHSLCQLSKAVAHSLCQLSKLVCINITKKTAISFSIDNFLN